MPLILLMIEKITKHRKSLPRRQESSKNGS